MKNNNLSAEREYCKKDHLNQILIRLSEKNNINK